MDQKKRDYQMILNMWTLLKEYGDITNGDEDDERTSALSLKLAELRREYPEERTFLMDFEQMFVRRAVASNKGVLKIAC